MSVYEYVKNLLFYWFNYISWSIPGLFKTEVFEKCHQNYAQTLNGVFVCVCLRICIPGLFKTEGFEKKKYTMRFLNIQ